MTFTATWYVPNFHPDILLTEKESDVIQKKKKIEEEEETIPVMSTKPLWVFFPMDVAKSFELLLSK